MSNKSSPDGEVWSAPASTEPISATVTIPGSKSQTSRALVIGAIAANPTVIENPLAARDTYLMVNAMTQFGASLEFSSSGNTVTMVAPEELVGAGKIDCGLAGTVMRFAAALAAFANGKTTLIGDFAAQRRPLSPLLDALEDLGAKVKYKGTPGYLPVRIRGRKTKAKSVFSEDALGNWKQKDGDAQAVRVDASSSSQFLSALLLASPLMPDGTVLRSDGRIPSWPYVSMSIEMLAHQGVKLQPLSRSSWRTQAKRPEGNPIRIEPDLANAGPFLAAALLAGGSVTIPHWPTKTDQVGKYWLEILPQFGASVTLAPEGLTVHAPAGLTWPGVEMDLGAVGELATTIAALATFATSPSILLGIGHLRGHETDRLQALADEINKLGGEATVLHDGLRIVPKPMHAAKIDSYDDHRMATFGALIGLRVPGCEVVNVKSTSKTLPNFEEMWEAMLEGRPSPAPLTLAELMANPQPYWD